MVLPSKESRQFPDSLLSAAAHPDPYPYYAALLAYRPIYYEHRLNLWIALGAQAVSEVLSSGLCRVRPPAEPVPHTITDGPAGFIFQNLVRMNDGPRHAKLKASVSGFLTGFDRARVTALARREATRLARDFIGKDRDGLDRFNFALPVQVVAQMIGLPGDIAAKCASWIGDFVRCLSPLSGPAEIARSNEAASLLMSTMHDELRRLHQDGLAMQAEQLQSLGIDDTATIVANLVGCLSQSYEATAGLIGNTLLALRRDPALCRRVGDDALLHRVIEEVARHDPPIHNTRRFVAQDGIVAGEAMKAGDQILVVLAAANRDTTRYVRPYAFDPDRSDRSSFTFGVGPHACAGQAIAIAIAAAGVQALIAHGLDVAAFAAPVEYRRSLNSRIPLFGGSA